MRHRLATELGVLAALIVWVPFAVLPVAGQVPSSAANTKGTTKTETTPRTPWGDPDLQGVWSYATLTPLERPATVAGREFFTREEAAAREAETEVDAPPRPGDPGTYNAVWFDRGKIASNLRTSLIVDPPDGRLPLTPEARQRIAAKAEYARAHPADSWLDRSAWDRCITYHGVPPISTGYNNTYQIFQAPGYVAIFVENIHDARIIPLDRRPRLSESIRQWNGDSRSHWEGKTLVVETTNYSNKTQLRFPSSPNTRAVERFTRVAENVIDYQFTIDDPTVYTRPWTAVRPMTSLPNYRIYEYACHEGNYAMSGILGGARADEKAAEEAAKKRSTATGGQGPTDQKVTRTPLLTKDLPMPGGYVATLVSVELPAGSREGRHMHSGTLVAYVKEGALTLDYEGKPTVTYKTGETFSVEPGKVHEGMNQGNVTTRLIATFVFPKDQPMTTQVTR